VTTEPTTGSHLLPVSTFELPLRRLTPAGGQELSDAPAEPVDQQRLVVLDDDRR
jgi:hypothetical protein